MDMSTVNCRVGLREVRERRQATQPNEMHILDRITYMNCAVDLLGIINLFDCSAWVFKLATTKRKYIKSPKTTPKTKNSLSLTTSTQNLVTKSKRELEPTCPSWPKTWSCDCAYDWAHLLYSSTHYSIEHSWHCPSYPQSSLLTCCLLTERVIFDWTEFLQPFAIAGNPSLLSFPPRHTQTVWCKVKVTVSESESFRAGPMRGAVTLLVMGCATLLIKFF